MNEQNQLLAEVRELIASGDIGCALDRLKVSAHAVSPSLYDDTVIVESRFNGLRRESRKGTITRDRFEAELSRLLENILDLSREIASRIITASPARVQLTNVVPDTSSVQQFLPQEKILGLNNLKQISWIEAGLRVARSVCRVIAPNRSGTGFLVGPRILMTNHHVIATPAEVRGFQIEFDYQQDSSGGFKPTVRYRLDAEKMFFTNPDLDYTFVGVEDDRSKPALDAWGHLTLNCWADPIPFDHVTIVQHPAGGYKQIALTANAVAAVVPPFLQYTTDTMPGSSGSPVFNDSWQVIAIHHKGGQIHRNENNRIQYVNQGILMSAIRDNAGRYWPQ